MYNKLLSNPYSTTSTLNIGYQTINNNNDNYSLLYNQLFNQLIKQLYNQLYNQMFNKLFNQIYEQLP